MANNIVVGMMDSAYFVGRKEILSWLNDLCGLSLQKIEETASGAVACQVMDALFPGTVPMTKVNWGAKVDYEFIQNYKVLQTVFNRLKVDKKIEVDKLVRARYQDNLEFMQWLKKFAEINMPGDIDSYDAISQREKGKGFKSFKPAQNVGRGKKKVASKTATMGNRDSAHKENTSGTNKRPPPQASPSMRPPSGAVKVLEDKVQELTKAKTSLEEEMTGMEKERDFYFNKLREVEILLQNYDGPDLSLVKNVLKVLYATDDDANGDAAEAAAEAAITASRQARQEIQKDDQTPKDSSPAAEETHTSTQGLAQIEEKIDEDGPDDDEF